jgi:putative ABC transport system permease protein
MIKNYLKIAWRNLWRNKAFSLINIVGLSVGLTTCLLLLLYVFDENSYDKHHKDADRIFRIASVSSVSNKDETWAAQSQPMAAALKTDLPEVEQVTRLLTFPDIKTMLLRYNQGAVTKKFFETNGYYVDDSFFELFTYDFIYGNSRTALNEPNTIVISDKLSTRFFGKENPVGKAILINTPFGEFNYKVKGVFESEKYKSHIPANYFLSMRNNDMWNWVQAQTSWVNNSIFFTYVKLKSGTDAAVFEKKVNTLFDHYAGAGMKAAGFSKTLFIQPLKDIYLRSDIGNEIASNGSITYLYILGSIGIFILAIACINFMNLSTARSQKRAKEVGVRKVMGAERMELIRQFVGESFLMSLIALLLALLFSWMLLPLLNQLTQKNIQPFHEPEIIYWIAGLAIFSGLLAGLYPAFYLSSYKPALVLKGKSINNFSATTIRKGLVVFQFTISICLIIGAIVIWQQLNLLKNKQLGFNKEQKMVLSLQQGYQNSAANYTAFKNELLKNPSIKAVTAGSAYPGVSNLNDMLFYAEGKNSSDVVDIHLTAIEHDYIKTLGISLLNGRSFSEEATSDSASIVLNEAAVKALGYTVENAVGKKVQYDLFGSHKIMQIIGVIKNFNYESLHTDIKPFGYTTDIFGNRFSYAIVSVQSQNYSQLLKDVERAWTKMAPTVPFVYSFLDEEFQRNYEKERYTSRIIICFTIIAILIACLGLFGLVAFSAEQRTKEIGVRKVLGASITNIIALLAKEFILLVMIAIVVAVPLAWYGMSKWLEHFAFRIEMNWWMFFAAGIIAVIIALCTVSFQSIKAALANPVKSLRTE